MQRTTNEEDVEVAAKAGSWHLAAPMRRREDDEAQVFKNVSLRALSRKDRIDERVVLLGPGHPFLKTTKIEEAVFRVLPTTSRCLF